MKKILILLSLFFMVFSVKVKSQTHHIIPDTNAIWSVNTIKYAPSGDTNINNFIYTKFYKTSGDSIFEFQNADYYAAVYEDSNKKVWAVKHDTLSKRLLYDFSLNTGDTVTVYPFEVYQANNYDSVDVVVLETDSVMIFSSYRKRIKITPTICGAGWSSYEYWIEGIGSTAGLFSPGTFRPCIVDLPFYELLCFQENGLTEIFIPVTGCFHPVITEINTGNTKTINVNIYPNPFNNKSVMKIEKCEPGDMIKIYDVFGKMINSYELKSKSEKIVINKDDFKNTSGVYFYRILSKNKVVKSGKLMIN